MQMHEQGMGMDRTTTTDEGQPHKRPKNIILCADGTGNRGGYTPDSNVYKVYKAIEKDLTRKEKEHFGIAEQIIFYDNGVGTNSNKYLRAISGGLGFGFGQNVRDLYKFLARNYEPGDRVFLFGFSRGASTIRAFNGFVHTCGLIDGRARTLSNRDLDDKVQEAFDAYRWEGIKGKFQHRLSRFLWRKKGSRNADELKNTDVSADSHGVIDIHFTGIWDTVVALGWPKRTDVVSPVSLVLRFVFMVLEKTADFLIPHSFYNFRLTNNQLHAYQALALDDERTAFWPFVWDENGFPDENTVEQVWFAGMHSNVGGGYNRSGLASVPLYWMMGKAQLHNLCFEEGAVKQAREDSHVHGRMYNSRDGAAIFYRYHPREIENLCQVKKTGYSKMKNLLLGDLNEGRSRFKDGKIKIYDSVIARMEHRTANYAPPALPGEFRIVKDEIQENQSVTTRSIDISPANEDGWRENKGKIDCRIVVRKILYDVMLALTLTVVCYAYYYWSCCPPEYFGRNGLMGDFADILDYILPDFFAGLIEVAVSQNPSLFFGAVIIGFIYLRIRSRVHEKMDVLCQIKRHIVNNLTKDRWDSPAVTEHIVTRADS